MFFTNIFSTSLLHHPARTCVKRATPWALDMSAAPGGKHCKELGQRIFHTPLCIATESVQNLSNLWAAFLTIPQHFRSASEDSKERIGSHASCKHTCMVQGKVARAIGLSECGLGESIQHIIHKGRSNRHPFQPSGGANVHRTELRAAPIHRARGKVVGNVFSQ